MKIELLKSNDRTESTQASVIPNLILAEIYSAGTPDFSTSIRKSVEKQTLHFSTLFRGRINVEIVRCALGNSMYLNRYRSKWIISVGYDTKLTC